MRIGLYVDLSNLYYCVGNKFHKKVDYTKYKAFIDDVGTITRAVAYGAQVKDEACKFIEALHKSGFEHKYKRPKTFPNGTRKADWDIGICVDIITELDQYDMVVIGSADGDMLPLAEYIVKKGKKVLFLASGIATELRPHPHIEIMESLLEDI